MVSEGFANFIPKEDRPANSRDVNLLETIRTIVDETTYKDTIQYKFYSQLPMGAFQRQVLIVQVIKNKKIKNKKKIKKHKKNEKNKINK